MFHFFANTVVAASEAINYFSSRRAASTVPPRTYTPSEMALYSSLFESARLESLFFCPIRQGSFEQVEHFINTEGLNCFRTDNNLNAWHSVIIALQTSIPYNKEQTQEENKLENAEVYMKKLRIFNLLLASGVDPKVKIDNNDNVLITIINTNFFDIDFKTNLIQAILDHEPTLINEVDHHGKTPLYLAIERNNLSLFKRLLTYQAVICQTSSPDPYTTLLLQLMHIMDKKVQQPLVWEAACNEVSAELISYLVNNGADIKATNEVGECISDIAVRNNRDDIIEILPKLNLRMV